MNQHLTQVVKCPDMMMNKYSMVGYVHTRCYNSDVEQGINFCRKLRIT
jgi:hypothetical protein